MATSRALALRDRHLQVQGSAGSYRATDTLRHRAYHSGAFGGSGDRHADPRTRRLARELTRGLMRSAHPYNVLIKRWATDLGTPMPRPRSSNEKWNEQALALWESDSVAKRLDVRRMHTWPQLFRLWAMAVANDGDLAVIRTPDGLSTIEADRIAGGRHNNQHERTVGGITLRANGEPRYLWVAPLTTGGFPLEAKAEPYDWEHVDFIRDTERYSQTRGMPSLISGADDFERIDSTLESTVIGAEQASNIYAVIKRIKSNLARGAAGATPAPVTALDRSAPIATGANPEDDTPDWVESARGAMLMLYDDQEYEQVQAQHPNMNVPPFLVAMLRMLGLGLGYPYELAFVDMGGLSWSASKTIITLGRAGLNYWRDQVFGETLVNTWAWWVSRAIRDGRLDDPGPDAQWWLAEWDWPVLPWPDPEKEAKATDAELRLRTNSRQRILGPSWRKIMAEVNEEERLLDALALDRIQAIEAGIRERRLEGVTWREVISLVADDRKLPAPAPIPSNPSAGAPAGSTPTDDEDSTR